MNVKFACQQSCVSQGDDFSTPSNLQRFPWEKVCNSRERHHLAQTNALQQGSLPPPSTSSCTCRSFTCQNTRGLWSSQGYQGEEDRISSTWGPECCFLGFHSHSQITDYLKRKFHSTTKFVQPHEAQDGINQLFPEHQILNFSCERGADLHGHLSIARMKKEGELYALLIKHIFAFPLTLLLNLLCLQLHAMTLEIENLMLSAQVEQNEKGKNLHPSGLPYAL